MESLLSKWQKMDLTQRLSFLKYIDRTNHFFALFHTLSDDCIIKFITVILTELEKK